MRLLYPIRAQLRNFYIVYESTTAHGGGLLHGVVKVRKIYGRGAYRLAVAHFLGYWSPWLIMTAG
jgi:hypothetical protein